MPLPSNPSAKPRRARPVGPRCRGGASSLLRLSNAAPGRLPSGSALAEWAGRARAALGGLPAAGALAALPRSASTGHCHAV